MMSAVTVPTTAGAAHFMGDVCRPAYEPLLTVTAFASPPRSSHLMMQHLISKAFGGGAACVPCAPACVLFTDDITLFIFEDS